MVRRRCHYRRPLCTAFSASWAAIRPRAYTCEYTSMSWHHAQRWVAVHWHWQEYRAWKRMWAVHAVMDGTQKALHTLHGKHLCTDQLDPHFVHIRRLLKDVRPLLDGAPCCVARCGGGAPLCPLMRWRWGWGRWCCWFTPGSVAAPQVHVATAATHHSAENHRPYCACTLQLI